MVMGTASKDPGKLALYILHIFFLLHGWNQKSHDQFMDMSEKNLCMIKQ